VLEPIGDPGSPDGFVELSGAPAYGAEALAATRRALSVAGAGAVLLAGLFGLWMSQRLTAPLRSLRETAGRMGAGDLSARAPLQTRDEIGELAAQFNQMAGQLEGSFKQLAAERDALRRFIADASHELRTPITALKNFNALLLGQAAGDPEARAEFLAESQVQLDRLEWITRNLLDLSRLEAGLLELDWGDHDLREILAAAAAPFQPLAAEKGISLSLDPAAEPAMQRCDRARLELALANLLDNALKFTPPGGRIELGVATGEGAARRIWVRDTGVGIHPDDLPHIFERFYRGMGGSVGRPATARGGKTGRAEEWKSTAEVGGPATEESGRRGLGLGLSIVERLVQAQGGRVSAESTPGQGSCFIIEWAAGPESPNTLDIPPG
jgi:signal transduction histidine kinase